ncbi:MAG: hypothetical protein WA865_04855 [Spirulinaceae cyanobacterium]
MNSLPPYVSYLGIGVAAILGLIVIIWAILAARVFMLTKGLPKVITAFFALIVEGEIDEAYQSTTNDFRAKIPKKKFIKLIKNNKFKQFKRTTMAMPKVEGEREIIDVTLILNSGREILLEMAFAKKGKVWRIDDLKKK